MMKLFTRWASRQYSLSQRLVGLIPAGILFPVAIPLVLVLLLPRLDAPLHLPKFQFGTLNLVAGLGFLLIGVFFAWWSIYWQMARAGGTPLPMMATQRLLTDGPFGLCRNPMVLGTVLAYLGISILVGSTISATTVLLFALLLLIYLKTVEERELTARFGQEYLEYKASTPFLLPRLFRRSGK